MLIIIQNDPDVPAGNIADNLRVRGIPFMTVRPYAGEALPLPDDTTAVIVLGGTMGANDDERFPFLTTLKSWIRAVVDAGTPYLGICLGGQLLAAAFKAQVYSGRWGEMGFLSVELDGEGDGDPLFDGLASRFISFQWHNDSFDIPSSGKLLAGSDVCPHQAFRVGHSAWGIQFHPEVTWEIILAWGAGDKKDGAFLEKMETAWRSFEGAYLSNARVMLDNFLRVATDSERRNR